MGTIISIMMLCSSPQHCHLIGGGFTYPTLEMCEQRITLLKKLFKQFPRPDGTTIAWHICGEKEMD
jgi:hypothetical protein